MPADLQSKLLHYPCTHDRSAALWRRCRNCPVGTRTELILHFARNFRVRSRSKICGRSGRNTIAGPRSDRLLWCRCSGSQFPVFDQCNLSRPLQSCCHRVVIDSLIWKLANFQIMFCCSLLLQFHKMMCAEFELGDAWLV